jgi:hypothetical protein
MLPLEIACGSVCGPAIDRKDMTGSQCLEKSRHFDVEGGMTPYTHHHGQSDG